MGEAEGFGGLVEVDVAGEAGTEEETAEEEGIAARWLARTFGS